MSYLSTFLGANAQGYSAFKLTPSAAATFSAFSFPSYSQSVTSGGVISWESTNNDFYSVFAWGSGPVNIAFYGAAEIIGLGNACIESNSVTINFTYDNCLVFNTILLNGTGGGSSTFGKASGSSLTAIYNLGLRCKYGNFTMTAFNTNASLTTVTLSEITTSSVYTPDIRFTGCALTAQSVENILVAMNNGAPGTYSAGASLNLSGGTSSGAGSLTAAAAAARTSLIAKGCTVTLNP